jgi:sigma-54 interacting transcriptional regulator
LGERGVRNAEVEGSNPLPSTKKSSRGKSRRCPSMAAPASEAWTPVDAPEPIPSNASRSTRRSCRSRSKLVARAVQCRSRRRERPFETLSCADLTRELLRSELFGHERGAFTGAVSRAAGLVSRLDGGTLFLDEIGELAPDAQGMLLRFLQAGEGRAVGASRSVSVDVRVIAATHRDLEAEVERGTFREDVYYRLWCAVLEVPPLRARREDIGSLVEHFRVSMNRGDSLGLDIKGVTPEAVTMLEGDDGPGNVRELEAVVKRAMVCRRGGWGLRTSRCRGFGRIGFHLLWERSGLASLRCRRRLFAWR